MKNVLILSVDVEIAHVIHRLVNGYKGFKGKTINSLDQLLPAIHESAFDILLLGAGFTTAQETEIKAIASHHAPGLKVIEHFGGGSGLLLEELHRA